MSGERVRGGNCRVQVRLGHYAFSYIQLEISAPNLRLTLTGVPALGPKALKPGFKSYGGLLKVFISLQKQSCKGAKLCLITNKSSIKTSFKHTHWQAKVSKYDLNEMAGRRVNCENKSK